VSHTDPDQEIARALRLRAEPAPVLRLSRRAMAASAGVVALAVGGVTVWAVSARPERERPPEPAPPSAAAPPESVSTLPATYEDLPPGTPRLGPPLPGDLGRAVLEDRKTSAPVADAGTPPGPTGAEAATTTGLASGGRAAGKSRPADVVQAVGAAPASAEVRHLLSAGTVVRAALVTGLNSDLPGPVIAQVTEDVFDSASGRMLLIPRGSRLLGDYGNKVSFGQDRVLVTWSQLVLPDGRSVDLGGLPATDAQGYAGLHDRVDRHWGRVLAGSAVSLVLAAASRLGERDDEEALLAALRQGGADAAEQVGSRLVDRSLDVQPTLAVRPGHPVRLVLTRELRLRSWP